MEQRHVERISLPRPILIRSSVLGFTDSAAVLRDISAVGAYVYTLLPLAKGNVVELFLTLSDSSGVTHLSFTATVMRVEKGVTENSLGIGLGFSRSREIPVTGSAA